MAGPYRPPSGAGREEAAVAYGAGGDVSAVTGEAFSYRAYGLRISSPLRLPELATETAGGHEPEGEVSIRFGRVDGRASAVPEGDRGPSGHAARQDLLCWPEVGAFAVWSGREILVEPRAGADERTLRLFLLGPVLAVLLRQRGYLLLHASAVAVDGEAVLFAGGAGWGKSTTAAALCARGHGLVTDDVAVLRGGRGRTTVLPGYPQLKLWPNTLRSLREDPERLPRCNPRLEKRARPAVREFSPAPLPLGRIYVLRRGGAPGISPLRPQEALAELVRHTYGAFGVGERAHFLRCARIIREVPVRGLRRRESLRRLSELARLVDDDLARSG